MSNNEIAALKEVIKKSKEKLITVKVDFKNKRYEDSVSRAYYSVFHIISACLLSKGLSFSSHKEVIGNFNKEFIKSNISPAELSKMIKVLFDDRQTSDYDVKTHIDKDKAEEDFSYAEKIFELLSRYFNKIID